MPPVAFFCLNRRISYGLSGNEKQIFTKTGSGNNWNCAHHGNVFVGNVTAATVFRLFRIKTNNLPGTEETPIQNLSLRRLTVGPAAKENIVSRLLSPVADQVTINGQPFSF